MRKYKVLAALLALFALACPLVAQTGHSTVLNWKVSTSANVDSQNVYRAPCNGTITGGTCSSPGAFAVIANVSASTSAYTDATVAALAKYVYHITAVCSSTCSPAAESAPSNDVAVAVPGNGAPNPPSNLTIPTVAVLQLPGSQTNVMAKWSDGATITSYKLVGTRQFLWFKWNATIAQGSKQSANGAYSLIWTGPRVVAVNLQVCDVTGCVSKAGS